MKTLYLSLLFLGFSFASLTPPDSNLILPDSVASDSTLQEDDLLVEMWIMPNGGNPSGILLDLLKGFEEETGLKTSLTVLEWENAWAIIHEALESGNTPHVLQLGSTWLPYFADKGVLSSLDSKSNQIKSDRFVEELQKSTRIYGQETSYGVPWFVDVRPVLVNKKLFEKSGIVSSEIESWQGFQSALKSTQKKGLVSSAGNKAEVWGFPGRSDWNIPHNFAPWIWSEGGDFVVEENGQWRSSLLQTETVRAIRRYMGFALDGVVSNASLKKNTAVVAQKFIDGEQLFLFNTPEFLKKINEPISEGGLKESPIANDGIIALPFPAGSKGSIGFLGGSHLAIPKKYQEDGAAFELLLYLSRPENLKKYAEAIGFLPPDENILRDISWNPKYNPIINTIKSGKSYPNLAQWGNIEGILIEMFSAIWRQVDSSTGQYKEKNLYEILVRYDEQINIMLGNQLPASNLDFPTFLSFLDPEVSKMAYANGEVEEKPFPLAMIGGAGILILGLLMLWHHKNRDEELEEKAEHDIEEAMEHSNH